MPGQLQTKVGDRISKLFCARAAIDLPLLPEKDGQKAKLPMSFYIHSLEHPSTVGTGPWTRKAIMEGNFLETRWHCRIGAFCKIIDSGVGLLMMEIEVQKMVELGFREGGGGSFDEEG
ncbi:hypothetical protein PVK06_014103 [Gossypium arboreum]|uniref:Uncharacterized protein n=1 Tax=Gossypium arboreum TaxID=29729 RepID=A0ABR0PTZ8_GOSAR|nr:hypothetical protein PVK06_014103 [Gossypium arboreum]